MDAFKLILVSLAGWMNRQQQHVIRDIEYLLLEEVRDLCVERPHSSASTTTGRGTTRGWRTGSSSRTSDRAVRARCNVASGLEDCCATTTTGMPHENWTIRVSGHYGVVWCKNCRVFRSG